MKGKIADSIIIKVGHGIMEIPRNKTQSSEFDINPHCKIKSNASKPGVRKVAKQDETYMLKSL